MVVDDTYYLTPHEAALAAVATSMKKARLQLENLIVNAFLGGLLFSSGSILCVAIHSENPGIWESNPGILDMMSGIAFGIGLFYVVIMGADLFNSNILFFSVGALRRAVSIYDLLVSWFVCLFANLGGCLFTSYVFCHLSAVSSQPLWITGSRKLVEDKASFTFIQTLLKAVVGNFLVCLAIYLQLMAKPIHVKFIVLVAPIFTFVSCGFTHMVADMSLSFIGMLNGADVSVAKYIWKLLIPAAVGNVIGGFSFSLMVPFYLHLVVVERDRKRLSLPEYEARDEQPELNFDSRVVRISPHENHVEEEEAQEDMDSEEEGDPDELSEKRDVGDTTSTTENVNRDVGTPGSSTFSLSAVSSQHSNNANDISPPSLSENPKPYTISRAFSNKITRTNTSISGLSARSASSAPLRKRQVLRSPAGVFPVRGMGEPLRREKTIENPYSVSADSSVPDSNPAGEYECQTPLSPILSRQHTMQSTKSGNVGEIRHRIMKQDNYNAIQDRPGTKLEKAITRLVELGSKEREKKGTTELPRTTQDTFPFNQPNKSKHAYYKHEDTPTIPSSHLLRSISKQFTTARHPESICDFDRDLARAGVSPIAAASSNNVAGIPNYSLLDIQRPYASPLKNHRSH